MGGEFPLWSMASMAAEGWEPLQDWISLSVLFCFAFPRSGPSPFLIFPEIRNSNCAEILTRFVSINYISCTRRRAPTDLRGGHKTPGRALVGCGLCGPPFALIPPPKNHIYSKIILREILLHFDFVCYGYFAIQKTCKKQ